MTQEQPKKPAVWEIEKVPFLEVGGHAAAQFLAKGEIDVGKEKEEFILYVDHQGNLVIIFRKQRFSLNLGVLTELWLHSILRDPRCPQKSSNLVLPSSQDLLV